MDFEPIINSKSIVQKIIDAISNSIIEKKFKAKDKIPNEFEIAKQLNVSRTTVREALKILSAFGVLEIKRGDGTYISDGVNTGSLESLSYSLIMDDSPKKDIVDLRLMLDFGIYILLISRITEEDLLFLENKLKEQEEFINSKEFSEDKYVDLDIDFHLSIANLTKNKLIQKIYYTIMRIFRASMQKAVKIVGAKEAIIKHKEIIETFRKKDIQSIMLVIDKSIKMWQENI